MALKIKAAVHTATWPLRNHFSISCCKAPLKKISSINEIVVGVHGLYLVKSTNRGVLLPQVATEYGWDLETFLVHTCMKAGLPENAWQKDCEIYIFSAQVFVEK